MRKRNWLAPVPIKVSGGLGEAWMYVSKSGKTARIYVQAQDEKGRAITFDPVSFTVKLSPRESQP